MDSPKVGWAWQNAGNVMQTLAHSIAATAFADQFAGQRVSRYVHQNFIGGGISRLFDMPVVSPESACAAVAIKAAPRFVGAAFGFNAARFCQTAFWAGVDDPRHGVKVDMAVLANDALGDGAFFFQPCAPASCAPTSPTAQTPGRLVRHRASTAIIAAFTQLPAHSLCV